MSDDTQTQTQTVDAPKPRKQRTRKQTCTVQDIANARAKQRGISVDKAAKEVRGILRANFDVITRVDPSIAKVKERANDGNRWPAMSADVQRYVTDRSFRAATNAKYAKRAK